MKKHQILTLVDSHHRLVTRSQVRRAGGSDSTWRRAVADGLIVELQPGVAVAAGAPVSDLARVAAAVHAAGDDALASHRSAAFVLGGVTTLGSTIHVIRPRTNSSDRRLPGVTIHRPRDLLDLRPRVHQGVPTTNPIRTLCDIGATDPHLADPVLQAFRVAGHVSMAAVGAAILRHSEHGRHGMAALRKAFDAQALDRKPPDSVLEEAMARLVRRYRLPSVQFHARLAGYEVDFGVVGSPLYLECDGWSSHGRNREQFEFDRVRNAKLVAAGHIPIHFTWLQISRRPADVAGRIVAAIRQWSPHLLG